MGVERKINTADGTSPRFSVVCRACYFWCCVCVLFVLCHRQRQQWKEASLSFWFETETGRSGGWVVEWLQKFWAELNWTGRHCLDISGNKQFVRQGIVNMADQLESFVRRLLSLLPLLNHPLPNSHWAKLMGTRMGWFCWAAAAAPLHLHSKWMGVSGTLLVCFSPFVKCQCSWAVIIISCSTPAGWWWLFLNLPPRIPAPCPCRPRPLLLDNRHNCVLRNVHHFLCSTLHFLLLH